VTWRVMLVTVCLTACGGREIPPEERVDDGWALARKTLTGGESCFAGRAEYCITEPAFVDGPIRVRLDELYGGEMPKRRAHVEATIRNAAILYKKAQLKPENVAIVSELVKEHYFNPGVVTSDDQVSIDLGVVPGVLEPRATTSSLLMVSSEYVHGAEWVAKERAIRLGEYIGKYPDKPIVRVAVTLPLGDQLETFSYRFIRADGRVVVTNAGGELRTTKKNVSELSIRSGELHLDFADLTPCRASRSPGPKDQDPPRVCPPDDLHPASKPL
jgi:hypothetical protein